MFYVIAAVSALVFIIAATAAPAFASRPPTPEEIEKYTQDGTLAERVEFMKNLGNYRMDKQLAVRNYYKLKYKYDRMVGNPVPLQAPPPAWKGMPTTGTVKVLILAIEFADYVHNNDKTELETEIFGAGDPADYPYESLTNYYDRASYSQLDIQGNVLGWTAFPANRDTYGTTTADRESMIMSALDYWDGVGHDFTQYDNDGDGKIDYFAVIWAGPNTGWSSFWWSYKTNWNVNPTYTIDGKTLGTYSWNYESKYEEPNPPGDFKPRTLIHETGHALGLPDYYDYDVDTGPDGGVGNFDMMDANHGDHNAFSKFVLDWITPVVYAGGTGSISLRASDSYPDAAIIMPELQSGEQFGEYFIVQNREQNGNDDGIYGQGLAVWHVDARLNTAGTDYEYDNSYTEHKLLRLMEADGLEEIEASDSSSYDAGDFYVAGNEFSSTTVPTNARYDGTSSGFSLYNLSAASTTMTLDYSFDDTPPADIATVSDGTGADIDTVESLDTLSANWSASSDAESGIQKYWYAVGTTAGSADFVDWTDNATATAVTRGGLSLADGQAYFFTVKAQNGAGLYSNATDSDGQTVDVFTVVSVTQVSTTTIDVKYTKEVDSSPTAVDTNNYSVDGGVGNPTGAVAQSTDTIRLTTAEMDPCTPYVLTITGVLSDAGAGLYAGSSPADVDTMNTLISSNVATDTTWTPAGGPYCVTTDINVSSGNTLTIQAGTTVYFKPDVGVDLTVFGEIQVQGTSGSPVVFTSAKATPAAGDYGSIQLSSSSSAGSSISGLHESYAEYGMYVFGVAPNITESEFSNCLQSCVTLDGSNAVVWKNTFSDCGAGTSSCVTTRESSEGYIVGNNFSGGDRGVSVRSSSYIIANDFDAMNTIGLGISAGGGAAIIKENNFRGATYGIYTWADGTDADATHNYFSGNTVDTFADSGCSPACTIDNSYPLTDMIDEFFGVTDLVLKLSASYTVDLPESIAASSTLYIQVDGTDDDTTTINSFLTSVTSDSDPDGIYVELTETGVNTGIYRGTAVLAAASDQSANEIFAVDGDTVTVGVVRDGGATSDSAVVASDLTQPTDIAYVYDGPGADITWASSTSVLSANWAASSDPETGVSAYFVAIGTTAGATDVFNWTSVGTQTSTIVGGLSLAQGQTDYVSVKARNGAGMYSNVATSDGQTVDNTAPGDIASINDGLSADIDYSSSTVSLSANWADAVDAQSGVSTYWIAIGTASGAVNILPWTDTGATATSTTVSGISITHGNTYYFQAAARNGSEMFGNAIVSDGVLIDTTAPTDIATVNDGAGADIAWSTSSTTASANWSDSSDGESGVASYYYAIGSAAGATDVVDWTDNGTATDVTRAGLALSDGTTYYFSVKARNNVSIDTSVTSSDGWTVDTTPPTAVATVNDGPGADVDWGNSTSTISANWSAASDPHSGIARYYYAVGTIAGATDVVGWTDNATATSVTHSGLSLTEGNTYYFAVKAENAAGLVSSAVDSDGQTIDVSAPTAVATVNDGTGADIAWSTATASLSANWSEAADPQSGILAYWYAVGTTAGATDVVDWTDNGAATSVTKSGLALTEGQAYYFAVKAQSGSLAFSSETYSNGQKVDSQPPADVANVNDGTAADIDYATSPTQLSANWSGTTDDGTGVAAYWYAIGTTAGATDVVGWTDIASDTSVTRTGLTLTEAQAYYFTVKAEDGVGFESTPVFSDGQTVDTTFATQSDWSPAKGATITVTTPTITFTTSENAYCRWSDTDQAYADMSGDCTGDGTTSQSCAASALPQGSASVYISCSDMAGNEDTAGTNEEISYFVDSILPAQSGWSPADGETIATTTPLISFTTDETAGCLWSLSDQAYGDMNPANTCSASATVSHSCAVTGLVEGAQNVHIACADTSGNEDSASTNTDLGYTVDITPPDQLSWVPAKSSTLTATSQDIVATTDEQSNCRWALTDLAYGDMAVGNACTGDGTASHTCPATGFDQGFEIVYIACADEHGNEDTIATNEQVNYFVDSLTPVQSNWNPAKGATITTTIPIITFDTDENATCRWYILDAAYGSIPPGNTCDGGGTSAQSCGTGGLSEGAATVYIACIDEAGNADTDSTNQDINYFIDMTPPAQSGWNPADSATIASTTQAISFTTDENGACRWSLTDQAFADIDTGNACAGATSTAHVCTAAGLVEGSEYIFISCTDEYGNADTAGTNDALNYTIDLSPPVQSGWSPATGTYITTSSQTITFTTDENADCHWSLTDQAYADMGGDCAGDGTTGQSCAATGLSSGPEVVYIACADTYGNEDTADTNKELAYTVDTTAPSDIATVYDGDTIGVDIDTTESGVELSANWTASADAESGIAKYWYAVGTTAGATDLVGWTDNGASTSVTKTGLALADGQTYYFTVKAENGVGLQSTPANSDGQTVDILDLTPPADIASVYDGPGPGADIDFASSTTQLSATWSDSTDAESGIAGYWYSIGTTSGASDTVGWTYAATSATSTVVTGLTLADGATYYVSVKALNGVGLLSNVATSDGLTIDATPPADVIVDDGPGTDIDFASSTTQLSANWSASTDAQTGISAYLFAVGTSAGATDTIDWTGNGTDTSAVVTGLTLTEGTTYYFTVKAENGVGVFSTAANSDGVTIDVSPPVQSAWSPADGSTVTTTSPSITFTTDENATCRWSLTDLAYSDMNAGNACSASETTSHTCAVSGLPEGANTIYISCADSIGNEDTTSTNDQLAYTVDTTPPVQSAWSPADGSTIITDAPSITLSTDENATCRWSLTDLAYSDMSAGDDCGGSGITAHTCAASGLAEGENSIYIACADTPGNEDSISTSTQLDYTVDTTPPARSGWSPATGTYITTTSPTITFTTDEAATCRWSLSDLAYGGMSGDCTGDGTTSQSCAATGLSSGPEVVYIACADTPGNEDTAATNDGLAYTVDTTAPSDIATVYDGDTIGVDIDTTESGVELSANWTASTDTESGIAKYWYAVGTTAGGTDLVDWTDNGANTSVTKTGLALANEQTYYFTVKAENAAGLQSTPVNSDGQQVDIQDTTAPTDVAWVYDGTGADIDYSSSTAMLSANWAPAADSESGIAGYWYSIGTTSGASDTVGWTYTGTSATSSSITGLALADAQTYYISIKAQNGVGLVSAGTGMSDGVTIDTTPPSQITNVNDGAGADVEYSSEESTLSGNWDAASDAQSGISRYIYAIGTAAGATDTVGWTDNGTNTSFTKTGLTLEDGQVYYISVKAENGLGLESTPANSDGAMKDSSPPNDVTQVNDGTGTDIDTIESTSELSANWSAATDPHSGIATYYYAIGTGTTMNNIVDWTDAGATTSVTVYGLGLMDGETYYFYIRAVNSAGLESEPFSSDGVTVDVPDTGFQLGTGWNLMGISLQNVTIDLDEMASGASGTVEFEVAAISGSAVSYITDQSSFSASFTGGYWIFSDTALEYSSISGDTYTGASYDISLTGGWNTFSNPYDQALEWSDTGAALDCGAPASLPPIYAYDNGTGSYIKVEPGSGTRISPWKAYWIEVDSSCTLTISNPQ